MNDAAGPPMTIPLAHRPDFSLASATIRPSLRTLEGPGGKVTLEPKVMQVLLAFADAAGAVVTRDDLVNACWGGRIVGEDAVNRTIAELRRAARTSEAGFTVETIPRIGYRLDAGEEARPAAPAAGASRSRMTKRTVLLTAGVATLALARGMVAWQRREADADAERGLILKARRALDDGYPDSGSVAARFLERAIRQSPRDGEAWGLLAYAYRDIAEGAAPEAVSGAIAAGEAAARRALDLDPRQGDALAALATLRPYFGDYAAGEERLMKVLDTDPDNFLALVQLVALHQGVGRVAISERWNERAARVDPQSPVPQYRRAIKAWCLGRLSEAEQAIERAMQLWPRHPSVWNARMMLFAFTDRALAALALLDDARSRPATMKPPGVALWRTSLRALETRATADVAAARAANIAAAPKSPGFANNALMTLSALGEVDAAFAVADGYFLRRGPLITSSWEGAGELPVSALRWRRSMALFVPASAAMRADPRFGTLMEGMGIADYWRERGVRPDYELMARPA